MARLPIPDGDGPETTRALALRPELQAAVDQLERAVWKSCLPRRLHELRRAAAHRARRPRWLQRHVDARQPEQTRLIGTAAAAVGRALLRAPSLAERCADVRVNETH